MRRILHFLPFRQYAYKQRKTYDASSSTIFDGQENDDALDCVSYFSKKSQFYLKDHIPIPYTFYSEPTRELCFEGMVRLHWIR